jgi:hypothetical protein
MVSSNAKLCSLESSYKYFHLYDVEFDLCGVLRVLVFHLS